MSYFIKQLFLVLFMLGGTHLLIGQINYTQPFDGCNADPCNGWDWNVASGNITAVASLGYTPCAVANPAARANLSGTVLSANLASTTSLGTSSGEYANFGFSYKVINITSGAATPANSCTFSVQYSSAVGGPWTTVETFQNASSTACSPYISTRFFPSVGQPIFMRIVTTRNTGDFWVVIDDISLTQPPPSQILATSCSCNNDQTPNLMDGTFTTALRINYNPAQPMASGLVYTLRSSTGLSNTMGGPIGTPTFTQCTGGCPPGIMNGEYYLSVRVQSNGTYSAMVDGPDLDAIAELTLASTTCTLTYPPLPMIPIDDVVCITADTMFASNGSIYNSINLLDPINLKTGFTQTGTGPLMVDYDSFDPQNHNPYNIYLIAQNAGCRTSSFKEVGIYRRPVATILDRYYGCREIGRTINLFEMFQNGTFGGGTFYLDGVTEVPSGSYTITGPACQSVTYRIDDPNCGIIESTATFRLDILPKPSFELVADRVSPVCQDGGTVSVTVNRTSTGPNPTLSINGILVNGTSFNLNAPTNKGSITYHICLRERTSIVANGCSVNLPDNAEGCESEFCRRYTIYNDGFGCGANALFSSQCTVPVRDVCGADVNPRLTLACGSIFSLEIPYDILTTRITMSQDVIDCTDDEVCGNFNASLFGIDVPGGGGPRVEDIPGIGSLCSFFNTCLDLGITEICPFSFLYDILQCNRSILSLIFDALAALVGGDGGDWILVADTDGDGSFDYMINPDEETNAASGFPSNGDFCIPNNMSGAGTITVRLVAGWPNKPSATCGPIVSDGINLLDLLPIGAIPIAGPIIEDILAAAGCNVEMAFSNYTDSAIAVFSNTPPIFASCNESGYAFQQELSCNIPINWSIPSAIIPCEMTTLVYGGVTSGVDLSYYQGTNLPTPIASITREGIYQTAGPIPGSILPPGVYPVTYTAVSCNGNPSQCSFNVVVTQDVPTLVCPNDLTVNTNVGQCTSTLNGLAPYRGLGGCSSILNYRFTDPVSGNINQTNATTPGAINIPDGHRFELGVTVITYTLLNDNNGDGDFADDNETQECTFSVTVLDLEKPHAVCIDSELILDNEGSGTVFAYVVANGVFLDGGSHDNCDVLELSISLDGNNWSESIDFSCDDEGPNYIQLRAIDGSGNERICFAIINVKDFFTDYVLNLDVPEVCFEPFQNTYDFSPYLVIAKPDGTNIRHTNVGTLGPQIIGSFGISGFLPDPGSTFDPGVITPDGVYTLGTGTGWITISYVIAIDGQINQINGAPLEGCFRMVHDIFRVQKLDPVWKGGFMCCDQSPVWLGGASWDGIGVPPIPAGMISLTAIRGSYPGDVYGEWTGQGVTFQNPDGVLYSGDEFFQFDPQGLDGTYTLTYIVGDEPCAFTYAQDIRVTCQDLHVALSDITVCPANWVEERVVLTNLDDKDVVVSVTGLNALGMDGAHYGNITDLVQDLDSVPVVDGRIVIPGFYAPAERDKAYTICVTTFQTTPFGCADVFCYTITVQDLIAPDFQNCPKGPIVVDAPAGWCSSFVNFEYPWAFDNCMGLYARIEQVDLTGLKSGSLFPVGLTILAYTATDTVGNQSYCELKIIVNDFHTPPSVTCPSDKTQVNDINKCGAIVNNIAPVKVEDNCINNTTVIYEIKDPTGKAIACGFEDASGEFFPVGMNTVEYKVEDQPLILITEVVQNGVTTGVEITNFGPAAVDVTCGRFLMKNEAGVVIDSFTIPTRNNKSTYGTTPIYPPDPVMWILPNPNIVPVGGTFTHTFNVNPSVGEIRKYCFAFVERVIDEAVINDLVKGEVILRENVCDKNLQTDFIPATPCDPGSFGMLNPGLPTMTSNGTTTALQNYAPSQAKCTFTVTVNDREAPTCIKHDSITVANSMVPVNIAANTCMVSTVTMAPGLVHDVNIHNLQITIPNAGAITAFLSSPSGTRIKLFDGICNNQPNVDVTLDETIVWTPAPSIVNALCNPLGRGAIYRPEESFKEFYGESAGGVWTLEIFTEGSVSGVLTNWDLEILYQLPYDQPSVTLQNSIGRCDTTFSWVHPIFEDNCCKGTVSVTYSFENSVTGESSTETAVILNANGSINLQGLLETKIFKVGKTTIEYTLTDQYGNLNTCGFMVTVLDTENPVFTGPACPDVQIQLLPGECLGQITYFTPRAEDNCALIGVTYCFADGSMADISQLPIGVYNLIAKAEDIYGNVGTCTFQVSVLEFIPTNSTLACNNNLNISLDTNCEAVLNADMILEGNNYRCYDNYCITITDLSGNPHANLFTIADEGKTFIVSISDCVTNSGVSCWGYVNIEEKLIPELVCPPDLTVACNIDVEAKDPDPNVDTLLTGEAKLLSCELGANINWQDEWISYGQCNNPRALVKRKWTIIDTEGNKVECTQNITIRPLDLDDVVFPDDVEFHQAINCADVINNPGLTQPTHTGWPLLNGVQVNKSGSLCMVSINYTDEIYDICEGSYEILRYWRIRNMCLPVSADNPRVHVQVIKVLDTKGPKIVDCPVDITMSVSPWRCRAESELPLPAFVGDACTDDFDFRYLIYGGGEIYGYKDSLNQQHIKVSELTIGSYIVKYLYKDKCGNKSECSFNIRVIDASAPIAVAKQDIVLSLSGDAAGNGSAKLYGWQIDNGSYDHCTPIRFEVRRPSGSACGNLGANGTHNNNSTYNDNSGLTSEVPGSVWFHPNDNAQDTDGGEFVKFCCEDIPVGAEYGIHEVELRVWDDGNQNGIYGDNMIINGQKDNYNTTWVNVRVENKLAPVIVCPADVTVTCDMELNLSLDKDTSVDSVDLRMTGLASAFDLCNGLSVTYRDAWIGSNNQVCKNGVVRRTFKATKGSISVTCPQLITITTITVPFTANFPQNGATTSWDKCSFSLDDARDASNPIIKKPTVNYGQCDIVGENIKIDTFLFEDGACKKWRVEYTYKNWCTNEDRGPFVHYYTYKDEIAPVLTCSNQMFAANPSPQNPNGGCEANVILEASATDALVCADESWVKWQMFFDGWADGTVDRLASSFINKSWNGIWVPQARLIAGQPNPTWVALQNQHPNAPLADLVYVTYVRPTKASGETVKLPTFTLDAENISHKVLWKVTDGCGNVDQCESTVMVVDKKAPTPYCVSVNTAIMQTSPKMVELWAKDFDKGSFDNCSPQTKIYFTFDEIGPLFSRINDDHFYKSGPNGVAINATAAEYAAGNAYRWLPALRSAGKIWTSCGDYTVKISVWDEAWNTDYCSTNLKIIGCNGNRLSGEVVTAFGNKVSDVSVIVSASIPEYPKSTITDQAGKYHFDVQAGLDYELMAIKDGDYLNGVTTLDLVLIQRHILGLDVFNDVYKMIAADAFNDGRVTAIDLVEIRKLILGVTTSFKNASWRFPIKSQSLNLQSVFPYIENYSYSKLDLDRHSEDFVAVKIGDINSSASIKYQGESLEGRSQNVLNFMVENSIVNSDQTVAIPVTSANFIDVFGYQMTLNLTNATFERIEAGSLEISDNNFAIHNGTKATMSFASSIPLNHNADNVLFTLYVKANTTASIKEILSVSSDITRSESYNSDLNVGKIGLSFIDDEDGNIVLYQNEPNPFITQTTITFFLPHAATSFLTVYDVSGKMLQSLKIDGVKGLNAVNISKSELGVSGVLYYTLESGSFTATKKMILIE